MSNTENRQRLTHFIVNEWRKECYSVKLAGKKLYATVAEECYKITSDGSELFEELESTQEEADKRLLLHAYHAGRNGFSTVVISSDDSDVFVLALAFKSFVPCSVYIKYGTQARTRYFDITHVVQRHGSEVCRCLPGLHAFTGCDAVSAFSEKGKMTALKLTKRHARFRELFQLVGTDWDVPDELFSRLQEFTFSCTAQIRERKMSMTCATVSSAPRKETLTLTSCHRASTLCVRTVKEPTTRLQSGAGVSRVIHVNENDELDI